jgi:hypothetical protein
MCTEIQAGVLHFVEQAGAISTSAGIDPFVDPKVTATRAAAILARFLLLPTDDELLLLGGMKHDVNLGTQTLVPTADPSAADRLNIAFALPTFCAAPEPPMWIAGTLNALSPAHGFLYALFGAGHLPGDIFSDVKCGSIDVRAMSAAATCSIAVSCFRSGLGEVRVRIPVPRAFSAQAISVPLTQIAAEGVLTGITVQTGDTIAKAMFDRNIQLLPWTARKGIGIVFSGAHYQAVEAKRHELLIELPVLRREIGLVTLLVKPLTHSRVVATNPEGNNNEAKNNDEAAIARTAIF